jgi:hypothetical protein
LVVKQNSINIVMTDNSSGKYKNKVKLGNTFANANTRLKIS